MSFMASPDVLARTRPDLYAHLFGGVAPPNSRYAVGGYGGVPPTTGTGMPTTGIPPTGGSPYPINTMTGGAGYMTTPGGYQMQRQAAPRPVLPSQPVRPRRWPQHSQSAYSMPTGAGMGMNYKPAYGAYQ